MGSTRITDQYVPYEFADEEDGPGCGIAHHPSSCLCDVNLDAHPVPQGTATTLAYAELAMTALRERQVPFSLPTFAAELLGLYDAAKAQGVRLKASAAELEELRGEYMDRIGHGQQGVRRPCGDVVKSMVSAGLTVRAIARFVERPLSEVASQLTSWDKVDPEAIATAIDMLSNGVISYMAVERQTGLTNQQVGRLATLMGVESQAAKNAKRGGGSTYTAEQYADVLRLRERGKSYGEIAAATGVKRDAVAKIIARRSKAA